MENAGSQIATLAVAAIVLPTNITIFLLLFLVTRIFHRN